MAKVKEIWEGVKVHIDALCGNYGSHVLFFEEYTKDKFDLSVKRGSKFVIGTPDRHAAEMIKEGIGEYLKREENLINDLKTQKKKAYKLNVKILDGAAYHVVLSRNHAHSTMIGKTEDVLQYLSDKETENEMFERFEDAAEFSQARSKLAEYFLITGDTHVYLTKFGGVAYKVNYYDTAAQHRKQINLGDVLIIVGCRELTENAQMNKKRSDAVSKDSADVIAAANYVFVRKLPEDIKQHIREKEEREKAKGKA